MKYFFIYLITIIVSCIFSLIFCYRCYNKYVAFQGKGLMYISFLLFSILIPFLNIIVSFYYMINIFEKFNFKKYYRNELDNF